jgi:hypothetical protein
MRVVVEEWIYTTLKKCKRKKNGGKKSSKKAAIAAAAIEESPTNAENEDQKSTTDTILGAVSNTTSNPERRVSTSSSDTSGSSGSSGSDQDSYIEEFIIEERYETEQRLYAKSAAPQEYLISSSTSSIELLNSKEERVHVKIETDWKVQISPCDNSSSPAISSTKQQPEQYDNVVSLTSDHTDDSVCLKFPVTNNELRIEEESQPAILYKEKIYDERSHNFDPPKVTITHVTNRPKEVSMATTTSKRVVFNDSHLEEIKEIDFSDYLDLTTPTTSLIFDNSVDQGVFEDKEEEKVSSSSIDESTLRSIEDSLPPETTTTVFPVMPPLKSSLEERAEQGPIKPDTPPPSPPRKVSEFFAFDVLLKFFLCNFLHGRLKLRLNIS